MKELGHGNLRALVNEYAHYPYSRCVRMLCGFELRETEWVAEPMVPFRPYALMLWDVPERALVSHCILGNKGQIHASRAPVPARFFATGHSFEEVVRRFEKEGIDAPYWCDFDTFDPGYRMKLKVTTVDGEPVLGLQAVLLGLASLST